MALKKTFLRLLKKLSLKDGGQCVQDKSSHIFSKVKIRVLRDGSRTFLYAKIPIKLGYTK